MTGTVLMAQMQEPAARRCLDIVAFDLSLTSTGFASTNGLYGVLNPPKDQSRGMARLAWIRRMVLRHAHDADLVVLEGYAFARPNQAHYLGELGGVIRLALYDFAKPWVAVAPASLKMFATGKGNATKETVLAAAVRKLDYPGSSPDEADALWLLHMAQAQYEDAPGTPKTQAELKALSGVGWPADPRQPSIGEFACRT